jgi:hypothetical protein
MSTTNQIVAMAFPLVAIAAAGATVLIVKRFFIHRRDVHVVVSTSVSVEATKVEVSDIELLESLREAEDAIGRAKLAAPRALAHHKP